MINFPDNPVPGQEYTDEVGTIWVWDGDSWNRTKVQISGTYRAAKTVFTDELRLSNPDSDNVNQADVNQLFDSRIEAIEIGGPGNGEDFHDYVDFKTQTEEIRLSKLSGDPDLVSRLDTYDDPSQADLNNEFATSLLNKNLQNTRRRTELNFIRNTIEASVWTIYTPVTNPESELPTVGTLFLLDENNEVTNRWAEARTIRINGANDRQASLAAVRKGTLWIFQDVVNNSYGQYVTDNVEFIGSPDGGQFIVEVQVRVYAGRASGYPPPNGSCEVTTFSPYPCISQDTAPVVDDDGYLWYNEAEKRLYVSDWDDTQNSNGDAEWIPVSSGEPDLSDYLKKSGGTMTGTLHLKRTDGVSYWNYIQADTPTAWHTNNKNHGVILNVGTTNSYKQQFKIQGRGNKDLFEIHDDGSAYASLKGRLNVTEKLTVNDVEVATESLYWLWQPSPTNTLSNSKIYWYEKNDTLNFNIPTRAGNGVIDVPDFARTDSSQSFSIYTKEAGVVSLLASGRMKSVAVKTTSEYGRQYFDAEVATSDMIVWRPEDFRKDTHVICKIGGFIP